MQPSQSQGLPHAPLVEVLQLELAPPSLADNTADLDRLLRALRRQGFEPIQIRLADADEFAARIRGENFHVTVLVGFFGSHWEIVDILPGSSSPTPLGLAIDLGSSTIGLFFIDLADRKTVAGTSIPNPQAEYGEDILSRLLFARARGNRKILQRIVIGGINRAIRETLENLGRSLSDLCAVTVAGNTVMSHFLLGLDPANIFKEPYIPAVNHFPTLRGKDSTLAMHPRGPVYVFPNAGSYLGGDLIAGVLACGMHRTEEISLLADVGTNAEVVLGNREWLVACAGAAGPALEGGALERGMPAAPGAIDRVRIDPATFEPDFHVLGDVKPSGICGSGVIDLIAEMFRARLLTRQGKLSSPPGCRRIVRTEDGPAYVLADPDRTADGKALLITEIDVEVFLKSKAAMYAMLNVAVKKVGIRFDDVRHFYVAGAFGESIDPAMAVRIGMIPDLPMETFHRMGNTAAAGAAMLLVDRDLLKDMEKACGRITYVELNVNAEFMDEFRSALFLPHTSRRLFPSVDVP